MSICHRCLRHSHIRPSIYYSIRFLHGGKPSYLVRTEEWETENRQPTLNAESSFPHDDSDFESFDNKLSSSRNRRTRVPKRKTTEPSKPGLTNDDEKQFFKDLLDTLLDAPSPSSTLSQKSESIASTGSKGLSKIEQQLRDMALNARPNTHRAPKPSIFKDMPRKRADHDNYIKKDQPSLWQEPLQPRNVAKDEEFKELAMISELKTGVDLSRYVMEQLFKTDPTLDDRYPKFLAATIKQASNKLDDPYLALSIFQQSKARGIESYIAGCTTSVYNSILNLRWEHWKDIYGMDEVIKEMISNGVSFNDGTRRIVMDVLDEIEKEAGTDGVEGDGIKWSAEQRKISNEMRNSVTKWLLKE